MLRYNAAMRTFLAARIPAFALLCAASLALAGLYIGFRLPLDEATIESLASASQAQAQLATVLTAKLAIEKAANADYAQRLSAQETAQAQLQGAISTIQGGLTHIEKERAVDPQLLAKYSRVYFLNENYTPAALLTIPPQFSYPSTTPREAESRALPFLVHLLADAEAAGVHLRVLSSFRSFDDQSALKKAYTVRYGTGANAFSADQGYSEHQLGTAMDFTTAESGVLSGFAKTRGYQWLSDNAYRYGFILSYPEGNGYYVYEPWHWRFVGVALASSLHASGQHFYDLDQREIDTYRAAMFDQ
jgi:D-alanyl-D-alanine carboxypeptidase